MSKKYQDRVARTSGSSSRAFESEFGKRVLIKYGWQEGEGLGRRRNGRTECVQAARRDEKQGLGAEKRRADDQWDNWWAECFNSVARTLVVTRSLEAKDASDSDDDATESQCASASLISCPVTCVKKAGAMPGKLRRVMRQEMPASVA